MNMNNLTEKQDTGQNIFQAKSTLKVESDVVESWMNFDNISSHSGQPHTQHQDNSRTESGTGHEYLHKFQ